MPDPTPNLGLERPDFNVATWHDQVNGNFTILDAAVAGLVNISGVWDNSISYVVGEFVVDATDSTIWECLVSHTSIAAGPMSTDRTANPTYWQLSADIATLAANADASADAALASAAAAAASAAQAEAAAAAAGSGIFINVKAAPYNAVGDGVTDDTAALQAALAAGIAECINNDPGPAQDPVTGNVIVFIPAGYYIIDNDTVGLYIEGGFGFQIWGAGKFATKIKNVGAGNVITCNGIRDAVFKDLSLATDNNVDEVCCLDLAWDGVAGNAPTAVTCENVNFGNDQNTKETIGVRIGEGGATNNSEHRFINCGAQGHKYGIQITHFNVLNIVWDDGGFTDCMYGVFSETGAFSRVQNISCAANDYDIVCQNGQRMDVLNCRTESNRFIGFTRGILNVFGCTQETAGDAEYFVESIAGAADKMVTLIGCSSDFGQVDLPRGSGDLGLFTPPNMMINCQFGRDDYHTAQSVFRYFGLEVGKISGGQTGTGTYTVLTEGMVGGDLRINAEDGIINLVNTEGVIVGNEKLGILDDTESGIVLFRTEDLTDNRLLTIDMGDADQTLTLPITASAAVNVREVTAAGAITVDDLDDDVIVVNKTVGAATTVNLPAVATRPEGRPYYIVDGKLDAATNNITVDPNGAETILGLSTWVISNNGGSLRIWPLPSGGRWYIA